MVAYNNRIKVGVSALYEKTPYYRCEIDGAVFNAEHPCEDASLLCEPWDYNQQCAIDDEYRFLHNEKSLDEILLACNADDWDEELSRFYALNLRHYGIHVFNLYKKINPL